MKPKTTTIVLSTPNSPRSNLPKNPDCPFYPEYRCHHVIDGKPIEIHPLAILPFKLNNRWIWLRRYEAAVKPVEIWHDSGCYGDPPVCDLVCEVLDVREWKRKSKQEQSLVSEM